MTEKKDNGETYVISPYAMYLNDDFYYVVGWSDKRQCMAAYRVDRMKNKLMKYVIDRFGMKVKTEPASDNTFYCYPEVRLSPTFYGWVFGFGGDIKILEPDGAVTEMQNMAKEVLE